MGLGLAIRDVGSGGGGRASIQLRQPATHGFTLLEVLVAMALLGIAVAALMSGLSGSLRNLARTETYEKATLVGHSQLNRLLIEQTLVPGRVAGRWDETFRWEAEIRRWNPAGAAAGGRQAALTPLVLVTLTVFWKGASGEQRATFETCKYEPQLQAQ